MRPRSDRIHELHGMKGEEGGIRAAKTATWVVNEKNGAARSEQPPALFPSFLSSQLHLAVVETTPTCHLAGAHQQWQQRTVNETPFDQLTVAVEIEVEAARSSTNFSPSIRFSSDVLPDLASPSSSTRTG